MLEPTPFEFVVRKIGSNITRDRCGETSKKKIEDHHLAEGLRSHTCSWFSEWNTLERVDGFFIRSSAYLHYKQLTFAIIQDIPKFINIFRQNIQRTQFVPDLSSGNSTPQNFPSPQESTKWTQRSALASWARIKSKQRRIPYWGTNISPYLSKGIFESIIEPKLPKKKW